MVRVFARAISKPDQADTLRAVLKKLVKASRAESGVLAYHLYETDRPGEFVFDEQYVDERAFEAHKTSRHVLVAVARATPLMECGLTLWIANPVEDDAATG